MSRANSLPIGGTLPAPTRRRFIAVMTASVFSLVAGRFSMSERMEYFMTRMSKPVFTKPGIYDNVTISNLYIRNRDVRLYMFVAMRNNTW